MRKVWIVETSSAQNNNCSFCSKSLFNNSHFPQSREWHEVLFCTFYTDNESLHLVCHWWHTACSFCVESSPWHLHLLTPSNDADHRTWKIQIFIKAKDAHNGVSQTVWQQKNTHFLLPKFEVIIFTWEIRPLLREGSPWASSGGRKECRRWSATQQPTPEGSPDMTPSFQWLSDEVARHWQRWRWVTRSKMPTTIFSSGIVF